ncbi:CoA ester lyase [Streptomyces sp. NPDC049954]|uniref:HpcH/HpaI aldolase/citrate lyase family protein n=1 Tax=Streptomyces sp. NPDC049954 TaxID=3155779 RepID=UPI0034467CBA
MAEEPVLTWLYAPGDRPEVVAKALRSGADVVLIDLEDAVAPGRKEYARTATAELLSAPQPGPAAVHVRVNALSGPFARADLEALSGLPGLAGLRLPKIESPREVLDVVRVLGEWGERGERGEPQKREKRGEAAGAGAVPGLYPLLESALGIENAFAVASADPAVRGIALGEADLRADLGMRDEAALTWPRARAVVAARAAGLAPPAQSVYPHVRDVEGLAASCLRGRSLGFLGRTAIHPRQLPVIERSYLPTSREVEAARETLAAAGRDAGALALADGRFVDAAVVAGARRTLTLAERARSPRHG